MLFHPGGLGGVYSLVELPSNRELLRYEILQLCALYYQTIGKERKTTDELNLSGRQGIYIKITTDPLQLKKEKVNLSHDYKVLLFYLLFCQTNNTNKEIVITTSHRLKM